MSARRRWPSLLGLMVAAASCLAAPCVADGAVYTASLLGRKMTIVGFEPSTGSTIDHNRYSVVPLATNEFDASAIAALERVVAGSASGAHAVAVAAPTGIGDDAEPAAVVAGLALPTPAVDGDRVYLILPRMAAIRMRDRDGTTGSGRASGVGVYVDNTKLFRKPDGQVARGMLGLFANFHVVIVDSARARVIGDIDCVTGTTFAVDQSPDGGAWNALTAAQKIKGLQDLVSQQIAAAAPQLTAGLH